MGDEKENRRNGHVILCNIKKTVGKTMRSQKEIVGLFRMINAGGPKNLENLIFTRHLPHKIYPGVILNRHLLYFLIGALFGSSVYYMNDCGSERS